jgi:hypothetical protein
MGAGDMKVTIERDLSTATCGDIAITAAEGGIGYWSVIDKYEFDRWCPTTDSYAGDCIEVPEDFVFYTITYPDYAGPTTSEECLRKADITPALIRRGIQIALSTGGLRSDLLEQLHGPFDEIDSDVADCVIQLGCFGELVFG